MTDYFLIGQIVRPHGVRGEMLVEAEPERLDVLQRETQVFLGELPVAHELTGARLHRGRLLISLAGCFDRDAAEAYRGLPLRVAKASAPPLPPGIYYWNQILGLTVLTVEGENLGTITEILETGANDVYVVVGPKGELLIPAAPGVVQNVDLAAQHMLVRLPDGLR
jgi:16S rRNA processing protein RimM